MKTGSFTVWKWNAFFLLFRQKVRQESSASFLRMSVSSSFFVFDSQINTILFITLHQHTSWEKTSALLDHSGMQQWEWTCSNAQPYPPDLQGLSAAFTHQNTWKSFDSSKAYTLPLWSVFICIPCCCWSKGPLPVFSYYSTVPSLCDRDKVRPGTLLLLKAHLCQYSRSAK